jgi:hypothetical protein
MALFVKICPTVTIVSMIALTELFSSFSFFSPFLSNQFWFQRFFAHDVKYLSHYINTDANVFLSKHRYPFLYAEIFENSVISQDVYL